MKAVRSGERRPKSISYAKWGYIFLAPFFLAYTVFSLIPLFSTFYNSFFENFMSGLKQVGPTYVGLANFKEILFDSDFFRYLWNTLYMWILGFIPQIVFALLLAVLFTSLRLHLKFQGFFKSVIYMPNLIMASAFAMLFYALFADAGPVNNLLNSMGIGTYRFLSEVDGTRGLIALMNFLMWFGNTTILLMAAVMGIDTAMFEVAQLDGANSWQVFWKVTIPLIKPILAYVLITCMIGGVQMFDVPQVLTNAKGSPSRTAFTLIMFLNSHLTNKNYGMGGALSVILFAITGVLSYAVFRSINVTALNRGLRKGGKRL